MTKWIAVTGLLLAVNSGYAAERPNSEAQAKVKYRSPNTLNFEDLLVKGTLAKPEIAVVTANEEDEMAALLRLRENFDDSLGRAFERSSAGGLTQ